MWPCSPYHNRVIVDGRRERLFKSPPPEGRRSGNIACRWAKQQSGFKTDAVFGDGGGGGGRTDPIWEGVLCSSLRRKWVGGRIISVRWANYSPYVVVSWWGEEMPLLKKDKRRRDEEELWHCCFKKETVGKKWAFLYLDCKQLKMIYMTSLSGLRFVGEGKMNGLSKQGLPR